MELSNILSAKNIDKLNSWNGNPIVNKANAKFAQHCKNLILAAQGLPLEQTLCFCGGFKEQKRYLDNFVVWLKETVNNDNPTNS